MTRRSETGRVVVAEWLRRWTATVSGMRMLSNGVSPRRVFFAQTDCPLQRYFCSSRTLPAQQLSWQRLNERMGEPLAVQERRNQLYGPQRLAPGERARTLLQADNVLRKGELYDSGGAWKTTTGDFFKKPPVSDNRGERHSLTGKTQLKTNFTLGSDDVAKKSTFQDDYVKKSAERTQSFVPPGFNDIHLADMAPKYMENKAFGSSLYKSDFDGKERWDQWTKTVGPRGLLVTPKQRHKTTTYLRATHFDLGSDPTNLTSETMSSYVPTTASQMTGEATLTAAASDRVTSHVFRSGDYNVEGRPGEYMSTQKSDYRHFPAAGMSTKTTIAYDHILPRQSASETGSALKALLQEQNYGLFQNPRDPTSVTLGRAFMKYDQDRSGFITFDELKAMVNDLIDVPASDAELRDLLKECDQNNDGKIDYLEFFQALNKHSRPVPIDDAFLSVQRESFKGDQVREEKTTTRRELHKDPLADCEYQIGTHFQFGTDDVKTSSVSHEDFSRRKVTAKPQKCAPPPSSKVMHEVEPNWSLGMTVSQSDYAANRVAGNEGARGDVAGNKERHSQNSVYLSCNLDEHKELRQQSLTQSSYQGQGGDRAAPTAPPSQYDHLRADDALAEPPIGAVKSESQTKYLLPISNVEIAAQRRRDNLTEQRQRRRDNKDSHFAFGFDPETKTTEQRSEFQARAARSDVPAAGVKALPRATYSHVLPTEPSREAGGLGDELKKKSYAKHVNPRDPSQIKMTAAFLDIDTDLSGKITRDELATVCRRYGIDIDPVSLDDLIRRCDRDGDGMIDYNEFAHAFSTRTPVDGSFETVTRSDYKPVHQRKLTDMQKRVIEVDERRNRAAETTHFFHVDHSGNLPLSTTSQDFIKPEAMNKPKAAGL
ncbi:uncharacterized protein [Oscarella lobularis]|uniref:uncharacterized protein isoform X2 n=1 Tax=Oscarella lobularis TaxID=121494 RepID=UPI003313F290